MFFRIYKTTWLLKFYFSVTAMQKPKHIRSSFLATILLSILLVPTFANTVLLPRATSANYIVYVLPDNSAFNAQITKESKDNLLNITSDGILYTTKDFSVQLNIKKIQLTIEYNNLNGDKLSLELVIQITENLNHKYFSHNSYTGIVCQNSERGNAVSGLENLLEDLHNIPDDATISLIKGDEDRFLLSKQVTDKVKQLYINARQRIHDGKQKYQTVVQVHTNSHADYAFLFIDVRQCDQMIPRRISTSLVHHSRQRRSTRDIREGKIFVVNSDSIGGLFRLVFSPSYFCDAIKKKDK